MDQFDFPEKDLFKNYEKSDSYFEDLKVTKRIKALTETYGPKFVAFLINPAHSTYLCYKVSLIFTFYIILNIKNAHILKKEQNTDNQIAIDYSFSELISSRDDSSDKNLVKLKNNCIQSGLNIHVHLERWFQEFNPQDIFLIDSGLFREEPIKYLNDIQKFFGLKKTIDFNDVLRFNTKKLVFCLKADSECSSFHSLPEIDENSLKILADIFKESNQRLYSLLVSHNFETPSWLNTSIL